MDETFASRRLSRTLERVERRMERKREKLEALQERKESGDLSPHKFADKKSVLDNKLRQLSARARTIKGRLREARYT